MNPISSNSKNISEGKLNSSQKEVRKKSKLENETFILVDIAKAIDEVKIDGFGRIVIFIQNGRIYRWEQVKSKTKRDLTSSDY